MHTSKQQANSFANVSTYRFLLEGEPVKVLDNGRIVYSPEATVEDMKSIGLKIREHAARNTCFDNFSEGDWWIAICENYGDGRKTILEMYGEDRCEAMENHYKKRAVVAREWPINKRNYAVHWTWYRNHKMGKSNQEPEEIELPGILFPNIGEPYVIAEDINGNLVPDIYMIYKEETSLLNVGRKRFVFPIAKQKRAMKAAKWELTLPFEEEEEEN